MVKFCDTIAQSPEQNRIYQQKVCSIGKWYRSNHEKYASAMKLEATLSSRLLDALENCDSSMFESLGLQDLGYTYDAKLSYFVVSDTLIKLLL